MSVANCVQQWKQFCNSIQLGSSDVLDALRTFLNRDFEKLSESFEAWNILMRHVMFAEFKFRELGLPLPNFKQFETDFFYAARVKFRDHLVTLFRKTKRPNKGYNKALLLAFELDAFARVVPSFTRQVCTVEHASEMQQLYTLHLNRYMFKFAKKNNLLPSSTETLELPLNLHGLRCFDKYMHQPEFDTLLRKCFSIPSHVQPHAYLIKRFSVITLHLYTPNPKQTMCPLIADYNRNFKPVAPLRKNGISESIVFTETLKESKSLQFKFTIEPIATNLADIKKQCLFILKPHADLFAILSRSIDNPLTSRLSCIWLLQSILSNTVTNHSFQNTYHALQTQQIYHNMFLPTNKLIHKIEQDVPEQETALYSEIIDMIFEKHQFVSFGIPDLILRDAFETVLFDKYVASKLLIEPDLKLQFIALTKQLSNKLTKLMFDATISVHEKPISQYAISQELRKLLLKNLSIVLNNATNPIRLIKQKTQELEQM